MVRNDCSKLAEYGSGGWKTYKLSQEGSGMIGVWASALGHWGREVSAPISWSY